MLCSVWRSSSWHGAIVMARSLTCSAFPATIHGANRWLERTTGRRASSSRKTTSQTPVPRTQTRCQKPATTKSNCEIRFSTRVSAAQSQLETTNCARKPPTADAAPPAQAAPVTASTPPTNAGNSADPVIKPADTVPARASSSEAKPSVVDPPVPPKSSPTTVVSNTSAPPPSGSKYSVQVAAYNHKPDAQKLASSLVKRGYQARVDGDTVPFRVRIGRYSTASDAEKALAKIKAKHMTGFVVRAPER